MAVYTPVSPEAAAAFLADYDIGSLKALTPIAEGVENSNFLLETTRDRYILTLFEKRVAPADLPFFIGLMDHLAARALRCPLPIQGRDGAALRTLNGRPATIVTFLKGRAITTPSVPAVRAVGRVLAELHGAGADFGGQRANALSVAGWRELVAKTAARADDVAPGLASELEHALDHLAAAWPTDLPTGIIHADLFPDNVFFEADRLSGVIDFYFACRDILAYDLAVALNAWCFDRPDWTWSAERAAAMIAGYEAVRPMAARERGTLPLLAEGAALRFLLTRLYDWLHHPPGALVTPKDPLEYLAKLRHFRDRGL